MQTISINRPASGQHISVKALADARFSLGFPTAEATLERADNDLVFKFEDGSSARVADFYAEYTRDTTPDFEVNGSVISGKDFFSAVGPALAPAAGPSEAERISHYAEHSGSELASGIDHLGGLDYALQFEGVAPVAPADVGTPVDGVRDEGLGAAPPPSVPLTPVLPPTPAATPYHERLALSHGSAGDTISFYVRDAAGNPIQDQDRIQIAFADNGQKWFDNLSIDPVSGQISFTLTAAGVAALKSGNPFFTNLEVAVDGHTHIVELYGKENDSYAYNASSMYHSENYDSSEREQDANLEGKLASETFTSSNKEVKSAIIHLGGVHHNDVIVSTTIEKIPDLPVKYDPNAITGIHRSTITSNAEKLNVSIDIKDTYGISLTGVEAGSSVKGGNEAKILSNGGDLNLNINLDAGNHASGIASANTGNINTGTVINSGGGSLATNVTSTGKYGAVGMSSVQSRTGLYSEGGDLDVNLKIQGGTQGGTNLWQAIGLYAGTKGSTEIKSAGGDLNVDIDVTGGSKLVSTEANYGTSAYGMKALGADALNEINSGTGQLTVTIKVAAGNAQNACAMFAAGGKNLIETTSSENAHITLTAQGDNGRGTAMGTDKSSVKNTQTGVETTTYGTNIIRTGSGDDRIEINGGIKTSDADKNPYSNIIDAGDGNNTIILNGSVQAGSLKIIAGDGYDTLVLKADSLAQLKSFYGSWLSALKSKDMIKEMSIDCIDIQCGDTATVQNTLAWLKGILGAELPKVTLNEGEIVVHEPAVATAIALALLDLTSDDNSEQARQTIPGDDNPSAAEGHDNPPHVSSASLVADKDADFTTIAHDDISPAGVDSAPFTLHSPLAAHDGAFAKEDAIDEHLFVGINTVDASAAETQEHMYAAPSSGSGIEDLFVENNSLDNLFHGEAGTIPAQGNDAGINTLEVVDLTNRDALEEIREAVTESTSQESLVAENDIPAAIAAEQKNAPAEETSLQMVELGLV